MLQTNDSGKYRWFSYGVYFLIFFTLSVQYKLDNHEAVRPLYTYGLLIVGLVWLLSLFRSNLFAILYRAWGGLGNFIMVLLLVYIFGNSIFFGSRQFKDALYLSYWILLVAPLFIINSRNIGTSYSIVFFSHSVIYFCIISSIVSILVFFGIVQLEVGSYLLIQNSWTATRLHGYLGQPTAFGALVGFSLILISYLSKLNKIRFPSLISLFLFMILIASGSKSALIGLIGAYGVAYLIGPKRLSAAFAAKILLSLVLTSTVFFLVVFHYFSDSIFLMDRIQDFDLENVNSRFYIWFETITLIGAADSFFSIFFGNGAGSLVSINRAAFNVPLHIFYDYGIVGIALYMGAVIVSMLVGLKRFKVSGDFIYMLGLMLLVFGFIFNLFISSFLSPFFNFQTFSLVLGIIIVNLPIKFLSRSKVN